MIMIVILIITFRMTRMMTMVIMRSTKSRLIIMLMMRTRQNFIRRDLFREMRTEINGGGSELKHVLQNPGILSFKCVIRISHLMM